MATRTRSVDDLAVEAAREALRDAEVKVSQLAIVLFANAMGGVLVDQECIRGQVWLRKLGLGGVPVVNVDNACAGGTSAFHVAVAMAAGGEGPILVVGAEKMWNGDRAATLASLLQGLDAEERSGFQDLFANGSGNPFIGMNASWAQHQLECGWATPDQFAITAAKSRLNGSLNPLAQHRSAITPREVIESPALAGPLTRLMCGSTTDGAAAVVVAPALSGQVRAGSPRVIGSAVRSGDAGAEYHDRMADAAAAAWKDAGVGPDDLSMVELHDVTSAEELWALESIGCYAPGEAGPAAATGKTAIGGGGVAVNPSGGLLARGHPLGATGLCQVVECATQLRGLAGSRQIEDPKLAACVNSGGFLDTDIAAVGVHVLARG